MRPNPLILLTFPIKTWNESTCLALEKEHLAYDSNDFDSYDELEQKMIQIAEKQEK